jgi:hypothetical protein
MIVCSCSNLRKERQLVSVKEPIFNLNLTSDSNNLDFFNVSFSKEGASFKDLKKEASFIKIDSTPPIPENFNLSFWFRIKGEDGKVPQVLFKAVNKHNPSQQLVLWVGGFRVTGNLNSNRFSSKNYSKTTSISRDYYDLPRLEVGKYYFLSLNKFKNKIQIYINAELYAEFNPEKDSQIAINSFILGVLNTKGPYTNQFLGNLRNFEVYEQPLTEDEIYTISTKYFKEIQPFNDAFELSKFNLED